MLSYIDTVFGFPISNNQCRALEESEPAVSQNRVQEEGRLVNPRTMRIQRLKVARQVARAEDQGILFNEGVSMNTVPPISENDLASFNSLFVRNFEIEINE